VRERARTRCFAEPAACFAEPASHVKYHGTAPGTPAARRSRTCEVPPVSRRLDHHTITGPQLADCYHQRWEVETSHQHLKTRQRGPRVVLRSRDPAGVRQETWAYPITYQGLRELISRTAAQHRLDTDRLSFLTCLRAARRQLINRALHAADDLRTALGQLADDLLDDQLDLRRPRSSPARSNDPSRPTDQNSGTGALAVDGDGRLER
jgi:hypothetical protein